MFGIDEQMDLVRTWGDIALGCMTATAQISTAMLGIGSTVFAPDKTDQRLSQPQRLLATQDLPRTDRPSRASWYRTPERNPLEVSWCGMPWAFPYAPPAATSMTPLQPGTLQPFQTWANLLGLPSVSGMPFALTPWLSWSTSASWPMTALPWMTAMGYAATTPGRSGSNELATFAAYRSDSGHAVAQITFPNDVVAAVAVPSSAASLLDPFFAWPRLLH